MYNIFPKKKIKKLIKAFSSHPTRVSRKFVANNDNSGSRNMFALYYYYLLNTCLKTHKVYVWSRAMCAKSSKADLGV
jgi:hypothetical protein